MTKWSGSRVFWAALLALCALAYVLAKGGGVP